MNRMRLFLLFVILFSKFAFCQTGNSWENDIQVFEKADAKNPPPKQAIVFAGSSSIRYWEDLQQRFPEKQIIRRGFGGSVTSDLVYFADRIIIKYQPSKVFIYTGENDIAINGKSPKTVVADFMELIRKIKHKLPSCKIYVISLKPSPSRKSSFKGFMEVNIELEKNLNKMKNCTFVNIYNKMLNQDGEPIKELFIQDNLHMSKKGYDLWQEELNKYL